MCRCRACLLFFPFLTQSDLVCPQDNEDSEEESELAMMAQFLSDDTLMSLTGAMPQYFCKEDFCVGSGF